LVGKEVREVVKVKRNTRFYTTKKAASVLGMKQLEVLRRINRGQIKAQKLGWAWIIKESDVYAVMETDWYQRYYANGKVAAAV
jgi:excisionase family DNA binding protein